MKECHKSPHIHKLTKIHHKVNLKFSDLLRLSKLLFCFILYLKKKFATKQYFGFNQIPKKVKLYIRKLQETIIIVIIIKRSV